MGADIAKESARRLLVKVLILLSEKPWVWSLKTHNVVLKSCIKMLKKTFQKKVLD
jgi:hypothetical protein